VGDEHRKGFIARYLDPASRLGEVLFGLIMVLSVTLTAELAAAKDHRAGARELIVAALGCNIAWGIIDAIMYIMNCVTERSGKNRLIKLVRGAADEGGAMVIIREHLEPELDVVTRAEDRELLYRSMLPYLEHSEGAKKGITKEDLYGAVICFWLVFLSCLPAVIPFFIAANPINALRLSNLLLLIMLFVTGQKWAAYVGTHRLWTGIAMVMVGLALVGVTIMLGG
jgi:VIT1/CCC1 family predicted Fe2+/Mn2+ transporter